MRSAELEKVRFLKRKDDSAEFQPKKSLPTTQINPQTHGAQKNLGDRQAKAKQPATPQAQIQPGQNLWGKPQKKTS